MSDLNPKAFDAAPTPKTIDLKPLDSIALARLIEEVRNTGEERLDVTAYNRTYHRHNR